MCREVTAPWSRKMDRMAAVSQVFAIVVFLFVIIDLVSFFGRQLFSSVLGRIHLDLVESRDILLNRPHNNLFIFIPFIQHLIIHSSFVEPTIWLQPLAAFVHQGVAPPLVCALPERHGWQLGTHRSCKLLTTAEILHVFVFFPYFPYVYCII